MSETLFYGPPAGGAGVAVKITDSSPQNRPGALGIYCVVAPFSKGRALKAQRVLDPTHFRRVNGRLLSGDYAGIAIDGFFDRAKGAGQMNTFRVTADALGEEADERSAYLQVWSRFVNPSIPQAEFNAKADCEREIVYEAMAQSGGDWGGPAFQYAGFADDSTISGRTIRLDTDQNNVFAEDALKGRKFKISGFATEFTIESNEASHASGPMLTLDQGFSGYTATGGSVLVLIYDRSEDADGNTMGISVKFGNDPTRPGTRYSVDVKVDGSSEQAFVDLDANDTASLLGDVAEAMLLGYHAATFSTDPVTVTDLTVPEARPANWVGLVKPAYEALTSDEGNDPFGSVSLSSDQIQLQIWETVLDAASGGVPVLDDAPTIPSSCIPHVYEITFSSASAFTVTVKDPYTDEEIVQAADMPAGTTGAAYPGTSLPHADLSTFEITADGTIAAGTLLRLYVWALPSDLKSLGATFHPAAWSGTGRAAVSTDPGANPALPSIYSSFPIIDNGPDWVKLGNTGSVGAGGGAQPPKPAFARGTDTGDSHDISSGSETFIYQINGHSSGASVTHTIPAGSATASTAAVATALQALEDALGTPRLKFAADSSDRLVVWLADGLGGSDVALYVNNGTINSSVGLTDTTSHAGEDGAVAMISYDQYLQRGVQEADEVSSTDLINALNVAVDGDLRTWVESQPGLVTLLLPGVQDATVIQQAIDFAKAVGCYVRFDLPQSITDELGASSWMQANITPQRFHLQSWPSWGVTKRSTRVDSGRETVPLSGVLSGAEAAWVNNPEEGRGWHKAVAGTHVLVSPYVSTLVRDASNSLAIAEYLDGTKTRDDLLNPAGVVAMVQSGPSIYAFGGEGANKDWKGTYWHHKQRAILHVMALLRANHGDFVFHSQSPTKRRDLVLSVRSLMEPLFNAGWFKTLEPGLPPTFENCVAIQCDEANNPNPETGKLICSVKAFIVDTTKLVEFNVGTSGISVAGTL